MGKHDFSASRNCMTFFNVRISQRSPFGSCPFQLITYKMVEVFCVTDISHQCFFRQTFFCTSSEDEIIAPVTMC